MMSCRVSQSPQSPICRSSNSVAAIRLLLASLLIGVSLNVSALAQSANIAVGPASGHPGEALSIPVTFIPGAAGVSTLQFDLSFSSSLVYSSTSAGPAAAEASKGAVGIANSTGARILVFGANQNAIGYGVIAKIRLNISSGAPAGIVTVAVTGIVASDALANPVSANGAGGSIEVLAPSGEIGVPPVISGIAVSNITSESATVSWITDKQADTEVEYWSTTLNPRTAALRVPTTIHSLTLNQLKRLTEYTFNVKSTDAGGLQTIASALKFTTAQDGAPALVLPRFSGGQNVLGPDTLSGIGLVNLNSLPVDVTFTAVEDDGSITAGQNLVNPVSLDLNGYEQRPLVDAQLFGNGLLSSNSSGYIKLERSIEAAGGFFLIFDGDLNFQDGANLSDTKLRDFVFTEIEADGYNKISIINDNTEDADLTIDLVRQDGLIQSSVSRAIPGRGSFTADLFSDLFIGIAPVDTDYVRVKSSVGVQPFQIMRQRSGDLAMLQGQDLTMGGSILYSPLYAYGKNTRTGLSVINLDSVPGTVTLRFVSGDGVSFNVSRSMVIPGNGKLFIDDPSFFMTLDPKILTTGYIEITGEDVRLVGSTVLGDIHRQSFSAALALISNLQQSVLFSHVASNNLYFTGIGILNPGSTPAMVQMDLHDADGSIYESKSILIGAGQRQSRLLTEYFPSLEGQNRTSGYIRLSSNIPIASFAAFGTQNLSMISAIPPQIVP